MNLWQEKEIKLLEGGPYRTFSHGWAFRPAFVVAMLANHSLTAPP
jgi:hypothetical protein